MTFTSLTLRAPFSARIQPAFLLMNASRSYTSAVDGTTASTGPAWLLIYEGSLISNYNTDSNENDVWASADSGRTWSLFSGFTRQPATGTRPARTRTPPSGAEQVGQLRGPGHRRRAQPGRGYYLDDGTRVETSDSWHSTGAIRWSLGTGGSFTPARLFLRCEVDRGSQLFLMGGGYFDASAALGTVYLQDVWSSSTKGQSWTQVTAKAPFPPRAENALQIYRSSMYDDDLLYVMGAPRAGRRSTTCGCRPPPPCRGRSSLHWRPGPSDGATASPSPQREVLLLGERHAQQRREERRVVQRPLGLLQPRRDVCRLPAGRSHIQGEQAVALTSDERLVVGAGYAYISTGRRIDYSDLWISASPSQSRPPCSGCAGGPCRRRV